MQLPYSEELEKLMLDTGFEILELFEAEDVWEYRVEVVGGM